MFNFNKSLNSWVTTSVTNMKEMFFDPVNLIKMYLRDVDLVTTMYRMFSNTDLAIGTSTLAEKNR